MNTQDKPHCYSVILKTKEGDVTLQAIAHNDDQARKMVAESFNGEITSVKRGDSAFA